MGLMSIDILGAPEMQPSALAPGVEPVGLLAAAGDPDHRLAGEDGAAFHAAFGMDRMDVHAGARRGAPFTDDLGLGGKQRGRRRRRWLALPALFALARLLAQSAAREYCSQSIKPASDADPRRHAEPARND